MIAARGRCVEAVRHVGRFHPRTDLVARRSGELAELTALYALSEDAGTQREQSDSVWTGYQVNRETWEKQQEVSTW